MASTIFVDPHRLRRAAGKFRKARDTVEHRIEQTQKALGDLDTEWQGNSRRAFYSIALQTVREMKALRDLLGAFGEELAMCATVFTDLDVEMASIPAPGGGPYRVD